MAGGIAVRGEWQPPDPALREVARTLPTLVDTGETDFRGALRAIYRRKWALALIMAAGMSAVVWWMSRVTPQYSADALIVVETRPSAIVRSDRPEQDTILSDLAKVDTEVAVLLSRSLAVRVNRALNLEHDPEFAPEAEGETADSPPLRVRLDTWLSAASAAVASARGVLAGAWGGDARAAAGDDDEVPPAPAAGDVTAARKESALFDAFLEGLAIESEEGSRLIRISFTSTDPAKAATIANTLVDEYLKNQLEKKTEGARRAAEWLEVRLAELGGTIRSLEGEVRQSAAAGNDGINVASQKLAQLNLNLVQAQSETAAARGRYQQVRAVLDGRGNADALPGVIASTAIQDLRAKQTELRGQLSQLRADYGDRHPRLLSVRAELDELGQRLNREIANILVGMRNEMEGADAQEAALRRELEGAVEQMVELREADTAIAQTAERLRANQDLYRQLLERYTEAVALRDSQQPDARIISSAQVPLEPSFPDVPKVIVFGLVGSGSLAALFLVLSERLRRNFNTLENVERHVGLPLVGVIPDLPRLSRIRSNPVHYMQRNPFSAFGGTLQRLHALLALTNDRRMPRTILVTSASAGEGKTTIAICLGIASAAAGERVLVVDCNFKRPQLHRMMGVKNDRGLIDVIRGTTPLAEAVTTAAGFPLAVLPVGRSCASAATLLSLGGMDKLLDQLTGLFEVIILDSPPVLEVSSSLVLGGLVEKTLLVTRRDQTTQRMAFSAASQLELSGAAVAGVVFNGASVTDD